MLTLVICQALLFGNHAGFLYKLPEIEYNKDIRKNKT